MGRFGKTWEDLGSREDLGRLRKIWEGYGRFGKFWEDMGRFGKTWEDLGRYGKIWEVGKIWETKLQGNHEDEGSSHLDASLKS